MAPPAAKLLIGFEKTREVQKLLCKSTPCDYDKVGIVHAVVAAAGYVMACV